MLKRVDKSLSISSLFWAGPGRIVAWVYSLVKESLCDVVRIATSLERLKDISRDSLHRNALFIMFSSLTAAPVSFVFWIVAARLYTTEAVGLCSAAISAIGLVVLLSTVGLDLGLMRFLPGSGEKAPSMINSCFTIGGSATIILTVIYLAGMSIWSPALIPTGQPLIFFSAFILISFLTILEVLGRQTFIARRKGEFLLAENLVFGLSRFIGLVLLVGVFQTYGILVSWGMALLIAVIFILVYLLPRLESGYTFCPTVRKEVVRRMAGFSAANYLAELYLAAPRLILPLVVIHLLGSEPTAHFYITWAVGGIVFGHVPRAIHFSLFAEGAHREERLMQDVRRSLKLALVILVPATVLLFLLADKVLVLFGAEYAEEGTILLRILVISAFPAVINHTYFAVKRVRKEMRSVIGFTGFIALATLGASYLLLPKFGIIVVGTSYLASQSLSALIIILILVKKWLEEKSQN